MTITVETGAQVSGSNSYVTANELTLYAIHRGVTLSTDEEELIFKGMDYLESQSFIGYKVSSTQSLQWPRWNAVIDGYYVETTAIPTILKESLMAVCLEIDAGNNPLETLSRQTISESIGPISVTYKSGSDDKIRRSVNAKLRKLLRNGSGFNLVR